MTLKYQGATNEEIARACMAEKIRQLEREVAAARADHRLILDRYELQRAQKEKLDQECQMLRSELARAKLGKEYLPPEHAGEPVKTAVLRPVPNHRACCGTHIGVEHNPSCPELRKLGKLLDGRAGLDGYGYYDKNPFAKDDGSICGERTTHAEFWGDVT